MRLSGRCAGLEFSDIEASRRRAGAAARLRRRAPNRMVVVARGPAGAGNGVESGNHHMTTLMATTVMTLSMLNAVPAPQRPATGSTLAVAMPPPGSLALMGLGGLALLRSRRKPGRVERATESVSACNRAA